MNENQHNAVRLAAILEKDDAPIPPNTNGKAHGHPDLCTFCNSRPRSHGDMCDVCWTYQQTGVKPKSKPAATAPPTVTAVTSREEGSSYPCVHCKQRRKVNSLYCTECQIEADKGRTWGKPCRKCGVDKPRKYPHNWCKECEDTEKRRVNKLLTISPQERIEIERVGFGMGLPPTEGPEKEEGGLKYRQLRFPYEALPEGRLKKLVDKACEGGVDPGLVVPAILTLLSSIPHQDEMAGGMRINLYCTLLALVGAGKDVAIDRAIDVTGLRDYEDVFWTNYAPAGERSLSQHLGDRPPAKGETQRQPGPTRRCIVTYELEETLDKSKGETSSVLRAMQHLLGS